MVFDSTIPDLMGLSWFLACYPGKLILFIGHSGRVYPRSRRVEPVAIKPQYSFDGCRSINPAFQQYAASLLAKYSLDPCTCEIDISLQWLNINPNQK